MGPIAILSPHPDDAVFSCWHVLSSSRDARTINIFTAIPAPGTDLSPWDRMTGADDSPARMRARLEAVRDVAMTLETKDRTVTLYAELPYATEFGWPPWMTGAKPEPFCNVDAFWERFVPEGYERQPVELSKEEQRAKARAMRTYRTQFPMLEGQGQRKLTHPELLRFELVWIKRR